MRTSLNVPDDLLAEFDRVWQEQGIESRSRAVREAMLEYVEASTRLKDAGEDLVALVGFDYRHHDVIRELHGVQHDYQDVILNTSHSHQGELCLESLFCRGDADRIYDLTNELRDFDAVRRVKVMVIPDVDHDHPHPHDHVHESGQPHDHGAGQSHDHREGNSYDSGDGDSSNHVDSDGDERYSREHGTDSARDRRRSN